MLKKNFITFTLAILLLSSLSGFGAEERVSAIYNPRTGDTGLDATLGDINIRTHGQNLDEFIANLSVEYDVPSEKIEILINEEKMTPADVYMTTGLSKIIERPMDTVLKEYKQNKGKGWGVIAKRLGVKPGSKEFRALKEGSLTCLDDGKEKKKNKGKKNKQKDKRKNKK